MVWTYGYNVIIQRYHKALGARMEEIRLSLHPEKTEEFVFIFLIFRELFGLRKPF